MGTRAFIGLGANLDDPGAHVKRALAELARLPGSALVSHSSLWRSAPVGYAGQPDFINAVAQVDSELTAEQLLGELQQVENAHGRLRSFANAPRTLDLDLLLYGNASLATQRLTLPHPRMHERAFVLKPLLEIAPDATIPGRGPAAACLGALGDQACEKVA